MSDFPPFDVDLSESEPEIVGEIPAPRVDKPTYDDVKRQHKRLKTMFKPDNMRAFLKAVKKYAIDHFGAAQRSTKNGSWPDQFRSNSSGEAIGEFFREHPSLFAIFNEADGEVSLAAVRKFVQAMKEENLFPILKKSKGGANRAAIANDVIEQLQAAGVDLSVLNPGQLEALRCPAAEAPKPRKPRNAKKRRMEEEDDDSDEEMDDADEDAPLDVAVQCAGKTKSGARCSRMTKAASGYCPSHA